MVQIAKVTKKLEFRDFGLLLYSDTITGLYYFFNHDTLCDMKITELKRVSYSRIGKYHKNGIKPEPHQEETAKLLALYGFDIEIIKPMNTPKTKNPDFLINGSIWETKSPTTSNLKTIKKRMHEASKQAMRIIAVLRRVRNNYEKIEKDIIKRFYNKGSFRIMILITKDGRVFEHRK